ncbi:hypothetical protein B0H10DRAFT_1956492, partial [Mycena sp. CBHHK59/15]
AEAVPEGIRVRQPFEKQYAQLTQESINAMYAWAEKPLQDYQAARDGTARTAAPTFPLSAEALDDMAPNAVAQTVTSFLVKSYNVTNFTDTTEAAFGSEEIPWAAIAITPDEYYDSGKFEIRFDPNGLGGLKGPQWHTLGRALAAAAGNGTLGFFRKPAEVRGDEQRDVATEEAEQEKREKEEETERLKREAEREKRDKEEEARLKREKEEAAEREKRDKEEEAARLKREKQEEAERLKREAEREMRDKEEEAARVQREKEGGHNEEEVIQPPPNRRGRKRRADEQLVPEDVPVPDDGGVRGRPARTRKTPKEAEEERKKQLAATVRGARKPGWAYVERSPAKGAPAKGKRGSTRNWTEIGTQVLGS